MSRQVQIVTPENIEISYELAGMGSRFVAAFVDHLLQILAILFLTFITTFLTSGASLFGKLVGGSAPAYIEAIFGVAVFVIIFGYFTAFELLTGGRSPGKRLVGLRVVRDGGYPIDGYASVIRNLVRIADFLPAAYGIGLVSIFFSPEYKRLGDYAGGTLVIKERLVDRPRKKHSRTNPQALQYFSQFIRNVDELTPDEFQVIRRFVERRHELELPIQAHIAQKLALPLVQKLAIEAPITAQIHYADLLEAIEQRYIAERGIL